MSQSIFCSALGRALTRSPLSCFALSRLNSTFSTATDASQPAKPPGDGDGRHDAPSEREEPAPVLRPVPLHTRTGRRIPQLLITLRDLGLAKDIPGPVRGKRNLAHTNPRLPEKRSQRRRYDWRWIKQNEQLYRKTASSKWSPHEKISYYEAIRRHKLHLAQLVVDPHYKGKSKFERRAGHAGEDLSLSSIAKEYMEAVTWFKNCTFSPFYENSNKIRIYTGLDPDIVIIYKVFTDRNQQYLKSKGYDPCDVVVWGWILAANDGQQAGRRMKMYQEGGINSPLDKMPPKPFPTFLLLHTIRRKPLSRATIEYMLTCSPAMLTSLGYDHKSKILFFIRLMRRVQEENILALPYLAHLIVTHLVPHENCSPRSIQNLTFYYNRLLALMARPPPDRPYQSHPIIQQSQFTLLRNMSSINIMVTREGYRAIISVQLARAKTKEERERIRGMKMSWPPWPEERDAWSDRRHEGKVTRAGVILRQMRDAGYPFEEWEFAADVLAGEDFDLTPTVAHRTYLRLPPVQVSPSVRMPIEKYTRLETDKEQTKKVEFEAPPPDRSTPFSTIPSPSPPTTSPPATSTNKPRPELPRSDSIIWEARIRATRTLEEAWSCFLNARDSMDTPTVRVYYALFEKIIFADRLRRQAKAEQNRLNISAPGGSANSNSTTMPADPTPEELAALSQDSSVINLLMSLPRNLTPEQRITVLHSHVNQLRLKQLQDEKYKYNSDKAVPGEGKEVIPAPFSPSEGGVHVPMMHSDGVKPSRSLLILLLKEARDMDTAEWLLGEDLVKKFWSYPSVMARKGDNVRPNWKLLTAYLNALVNSGYVERAVRLLITCSAGEKDGMRWRYLPAWNVALKALVNSERPDPSSTQGGRSEAQRSRVERIKKRALLVWKIYLLMRDLKVEIDEETLMALCEAAQRQLEAEREWKETWTGEGLTQGEAEILWDGKRPWEQVIRVFRSMVGWTQRAEEKEEEIRNLKRLAEQDSDADKEGASSLETEDPTLEPFWASLDDDDVPGEFFSSIDPFPTPPTTPPPALLPPHYVPSFPALHSYLRLLGHACQHTELLLTLSWMVRVVRSGDVNVPLAGTDAVGATAGDKRRCRVMVTCVRVFLERGGKGGPQGWEGEVARKLIEGVGEGAEGGGRDMGVLWGGWPTDEEAETYKANGVNGLTWGTSGESGSG
ncbi:hypothetical protein BDZ91DRAFT_725901 [Kalaharituber pfeilii]|nr:hypothetical protein BDZ91DRAFT_725901 [Kalaharituber pfeilii]